MKWPDKKVDAPIKPYNRNRCKLTNGNCAIDAERQARLYMEWALRKGLKKIHVFPENTRSQPSTLSHYGLRAGLRDSGQRWMVFENCNPEDWK